MAEKQVPATTPKPPSPSIAAPATSAASAVRSGEDVSPDTALGMSTGGWGMESLRGLMPGQGSAAAVPPFDAEAEIKKIRAFPDPVKISMIEKLLEHGWFDAPTADKVRVAQEGYRSLSEKGKLEFAQRDGGTLADELKAAGAVLDPPKGASRLAGMDAADMQERATKLASDAYDDPMAFATQTYGWAMGAVDDLQDVELDADMEDGRVTGKIPHVGIPAIEHGGMECAGGFANGIEFTMDRGADAELKLSVAAAGFQGIQVALDAMTVTLPSLLLAGLSLNTTPKDDDDVHDLVVDYVDDIGRTLLRESAGLGDQIAVGNFNPASFTSRLGIGLSGMQGFTLKVNGIHLPGGVKATHEDGSSESIESLTVSGLDVTLEQHETVDLLTEEKLALETVHKRTITQEQRLDWLSQHLLDLDEMKRLAEAAKGRADNGQELTDKEQDDIAAWNQASKTGVATVKLGSIQAGAAEQTSEKDGVKTTSKAGSAVVKDVSTTITGPQLGASTEGTGTAEDRVKALDDQLFAQGNTGTLEERQAAEKERARGKDLLDEGMMIESSVGSVEAGDVETETTGRGKPSKTTVAGASATGIHTLQTRNEMDLDTAHGDASGIWMDSRDNGTTGRDHATTSVGSASADGIHLSTSTDTTSNTTTTTGRVASAGASDVVTTDDLTTGKGGHTSSRTSVGEASAHGIAFGATSTLSDDEKTSDSSFRASVDAADVQDVEQASTDNKGVTSTVSVGDASVRDVNASGTAHSREGRGNVTSGSSTLHADVGSVAAHDIDYASGGMKAHVDEAGAEGIDVATTGSYRGLESTASTLDADVARANALGITYDGGDGTSASVDSASVRGIGAHQGADGTVATIDGASADGVEYHDTNTGPDGMPLDAKLGHVELGRSGVALDADSNLVGASVDGLDLEGIDVDLLRMDLSEKDEETQKGVDEAGSDTSRLDAGALGGASGTFRLVVPIEHYGLGTMTVTVPAKDGFINISDIDIAFTKKKGPGLSKLVSGAASNIVRIEEGRGLVVLAGGMCICMDMNDYAGLQSGKAGGGRGRIDVERFTEALMSGGACTAELTQESIEELSANVEKSKKRADRREARIDRKEEKALAKAERKSERTGEAIPVDQTIDDDTEEMIAYYEQYLLEGYGVELGRVQVHLDGLDLGDGALGYVGGPMAQLSGGEGVNEFEIHGELGTSLSIGANQIQADSLTAEGPNGEPLALTDVGVRGLEVNVAQPLSKDRKITVHVDGTTIDHIDYGDVSKLG